MEALNFAHNSEVMPTAIISFLTREEHLSHLQNKTSRGEKNVSLILQILLPKGGFQEKKKKKGNGLEG